MTIRLKILSIAVALLLVFGIVVGISAILQRQVAGQIGGITRYHQPLTAAIANFDAISFEYELLPLRLLRRSDVSRSDIDSAAERERQIAAEMEKDFGVADGTIAAAVDDSRLSFPDRLAFARLQGLVTLLHRKLPGFVHTGQAVMQAIAAGRLDDARQLSLDFRADEEAFGSDIASVRQTLVKLTDKATAAIHREQMALEYISFVLFAVAGCLGLGIGIVVATAVIRTLQRLVEAAQAVGAGELSVLVPVRTRDEIGQLATAFNAMVVELRAKERIKDTFGQFIDPRIVSGLIGADAGATPEAERRVVTVFFSDIQGFTAISEQLTAGAMVNFLNHYFEAVTRCIRADNGIVDKYIGDAVMAFWSPPFSTGDSHAAAACLAALAQQEAIEVLRADLPNIIGLRRNAPNLFVRMGIATGEVVVGTIGSPVSKSFTVIGDTVNLASRLESINKVYGTRVIVADDTLRLAQEHIEVRELDLITVAGKTEPVRIHELLAPFGGLTSAEAELREEFAGGLLAYREREWDEAQRRFERCLTLRPQDGPAAVYLERIAALRAEPPAADWDGVWRFTHK
jgi:class 3 adenylate cyclase